MTSLTRMSIRIAPNVLDLLCTKQGISRDELARQVGVTPKTVYRIQHGLTQPGNYFIAALLSFVAKINGGEPADHFGTLFVVGA